VTLRDPPSAFDPVAARIPLRPTPRDSEYANQFLRPEMPIKQHASAPPRSDHVGPLLVQYYYDDQPRPRPNHAGDRPAGLPSDYHAQPAPPAPSYLAADTHEYSPLIADPPAAHHTVAAAPPHRDHSRDPPAGKPTLAAHVAESDSPIVAQPPAAFDMADPRPRRDHSRDHPAGLPTFRQHVSVSVRC
jgi:hypothetical protein